MADLCVFGAVSDRKRGGEMRVLRVREITEVRGCFDDEWEVGLDDVRWALEQDREDTSNPVDARTVSTCAVNCREGITDAPRYGLLCHFQRSGSFSSFRT